jgi:hypothetical protein
VRQREVEALRSVRAACRAMSFICKTVKEHHAALTAETPIRLSLWGLLHVVGQIEIKTLRQVPTTYLADAFIREAIVKHYLTLLAKAPVRLL